jgi:diphosphomevalonate decarboxylase
MKAALVGRDVTRLFELAERSTLAMHASAMGAGVIYMRDRTFDVLAAVRELRARGVCAYATSDAGPHVKVLTQGRDAAAVRAALETLPSVLRVIEARPGPGARMLTANATSHSSALEVR